MASIDGLHLPSSERGSTQAKADGNVRIGRQARRGELDRVLHVDRLCLRPRRTRRPANVFACVFKLVNVALSTRPRQARPSFGDARTSPRRSRSRSGSTTLCSLRRRQTTAATATGGTRWRSCRRPVQAFAESHVRLRQWQWSPRPQGRAGRSLTVTGREMSGYARMFPATSWEPGLAPAAQRKDGR